MSAKKTKAEKRERKKKPGMAVSGKSVFDIKKIIEKPKPSDKAARH